MITLSFLFLLLTRGGLPVVQIVDFCFYTGNIPILNPPSTGNEV